MTLHRCSIGSTTDGLATDPDGGLTLYIQHDQPDDAANWLPAPSGPFNLTRRFYGSDITVLDGTYRLPEYRRQPKQVCAHIGMTEPGAASSDSWQSACVWSVGTVAHGQDHSAHFPDHGQWLPLSCGAFSFRYPWRVMREESLAAVLASPGNAGNGRRRLALPG